MPNVTSTGALESITWAGKGPQGAVVASKGGNTYSWYDNKNSGTVYYWIIDASRCNSIYGSSDTVTPLSKSTLYILKY